MTNKKHQIKSSWYYIFWGLMSASVVAGQLYVGTGYREMSKSIKRTGEHVIHLHMEYQRSLIDLRKN
tara:strand:+ start:207 stop:407 length:201 start_codon:yes stop_codon:yes gene_type:complete